MDRNIGYVAQLQDMFSTEISFKLHHWFESYAGFAGLGNKAGLPRPKFLYWPANLLCIVNYQKEGFLK